MECWRRVMTLPGLYQIINGEVRVSMLRKVEIEDLLEREPVQLRIDKIMDYVSGKQEAEQFKYIGLRK